MPAPSPAPISPRFPALVRVPPSFSGLTPEWVTAALAARWPGCAVDTVTVTDAAEGTNRRARLHLTYRSGSGPDRVFVKLPGRIPHRLALIAAGALHTEARLARSGTALPIEHPEVLAAGIDRPRLRSAMVMEDVTTRGGRPNEATGRSGAAEVAGGLAELAGLHASFWAGRLPTELGFLRPWRLGPGWAPLSAAGLTLGRARWTRLVRSGTDFGRPLPAGIGQLEREFRRSAALAAVGPVTLLHGDPHPGNTYSLPGGRTGFYDWQLARIGHWSHDVGYYIVATLDPPERRAHERDLLAGYLAGLAAGGVDAPSFDEAWARYRATPAYGLGAWLHTLAAGTLQATEVAATTIGRFAAAYEDLETDRSLVAGALTSRRPG